jgi:hypothetical protein
MMKLVRTKQIGNNNGRSARSSPYSQAPFDKMEAIACGVQARLEESTSFSRKITDETVNTARALGVADAIIERWAARRLNRLAQETQRLREIRALLHQVYWDSPRTTIS